MPVPGRGGRDCTPAAKLRKRAQSLSGAALTTLAELMKAAETPAPIRLAAAREVLDRGHGRPRLGGETDGAPEGLTVIVKRYGDITEEEKARAEEGEP